MLHPSTYTGGGTTTEKKLGRGGGGRFRSWPWLCVAAISGLILSAPVVIDHWRRRSVKPQGDWMSAYVRGCLDRNRRSW